MSFLSGILGLDAGKATQKAAKQNSKLYDQLGSTGQGYIDTGEQKSADYLNQAVDQFSPYNQTGQAANSTLANALGLNGPQGNAAATNAFQAGPGYQFAVDQSLQAAQRGASAGGMLASGNLLTELQNRGNQLANQEYGGWLDRLAQQSSQGFQSANATAGGYSGLADLFQRTTGQRLGLASEVTGGKAGANSQYAQGGEMNAKGLAGLGSDLGGLLGKAIPFKGFL